MNPSGSVWVEGSYLPMQQTELSGTWDDIVAAGKKVCSTATNPLIQMGARMVGGKAGSAAQTAAGVCAAASGSSREAPGKYPAGSVARFHTRERIYWIFLPGSPLSGADVGGGACANMTGCNMNLAGARVENLGGPDVIGKEATPPPGAVMGGPIGPIYTKWWFWGLVAGGVVAAIGTTTVLLRRRR